MYLIEGLLRGVGFETDLRNGNRGVGAQARIPRYIGYWLRASASSILFLIITTIIGQINIVLTMISFYRPVAS